MLAPPPWDDDLEAYRKALADAGVEVSPRWVEVPLVCDEIKCAGTTDRLVRVNGRYHIADLKTGGYLAWDEYAIQLAVYARSVPYNLESGERRKWPKPVDLERGLVIHLPAGKAECTLYWVDIAAGWEAAQYATWVREWRKRKDLSERLP